MNKIRSALALLFVGLVLGIYLLGWMGEAEFWSQDKLFQRSSVIPTNVVIVGVDDESLEALGRWPWPRDYHAQLIETISRGNPAAIGVDIIFAEESGQDEALIRAVDTVGSRLVIASYARLAEESAPGRIEAVEFTGPFEGLGRSAKLGHINTLPDVDGIVRRSLDSIQVGNDVVYSFAHELYRVAKGEEPSLSLDEWQRFWIRYSGITGRIERIPYYNVLSGEVDPEYFRDKIVLVGPTAVGLADDYYFTALDRAYPMYGIEIHANVLIQMLRGQTWTEASRGIGILSILLVGAISALLCSMVRPWLAAISVLALSGAYVVIAMVLAQSDRGYLMLVFHPLLTMAVVYIGMTILNYVQEQVEKNRIRKIFGKYMAPQVVQQLLDQGGEESVQLGGVKRFISVLFVDIRGFTTMSEGCEPEEVVQILNDYLSLCAEAIFAYEGTLDKYIGDAAMAIYNAPLDLENHALRAVQTAWKMKGGAKELSDRIQRKYGKQVAFGIGVNSGYATVGNIGASFRLDYTAIGDTVNTAARLESNAAPGQILISESTYELVKDFVEAKSLGEIQVKGKHKAVNVYELLDVRTMEMPQNKMGGRDE